MTRFWSRFGGLSAFLSASINLETEDGRSRARYRALTLTVLTSFMARGTAIATTLLSVPLTLNYLGSERFGMWMVLSSFTLLLGFADLGIGNSVLTAVARNSASRDSTEIKRLISSAYAVTSIIAAVMLAAIALVYDYVNWPSLFNVSSAIAEAEAGPASAVFFIILSLSTPLSLISRIQLGLQMGFRASIWQGVGSIFALAAVYLATELEASLPWLVVSLSGTPALIALCNSLHFFLRTRPDLRPNLLLLNRTSMGSISGGGLMFLVLQVCAAIMFQSNAIVVAQIMNADAVATFSIADRMFGLVGMLLGMLLMPLWPAYGEALASRDLEWVRRTFRNSLIASIILATFLSVIFVGLGPTLIDWWVGDAINVPLSLLLGFGIWKVIEVVGNAVAMLLNGLNEIRSQAALAVLNAIANITLKIWLVAEFGLAGVMIATILSYSIFALPWMGWLVRSAMRRAEKRQEILAGVVS